MTGIENMYLGVRYVFAITFRFTKIEREIVLSPDHQETRLLLAHPGLPLWVRLHIGSIVIEQIALNIGLVGLVEEIEFIGPEIRIVAFHVRIVADMPGARGRERKQIRAQSALIRGAIGPECPPRLPIRTQAFVV